MSWRQFIISLKLPTKCLICNSWQKDSLCQQCIKHFLLPQLTLWRCRGCARLNDKTLDSSSHYCGACLNKNYAFDAALAAVSFTFPWDKLINRYKFQAQFALAKILADCMLLNPLIVAAVKEADLLLPVPLSTQRLQQRGYNQAALLARAIAQKMQPNKVNERIIVRHKNTAIQHQLNKKQRLQNVSNAFSVSAEYAFLLRNANITLIDDVMTSAATLNAVAKVAKQSNAAKVTALVFARAELN